MTYGSAHDLLSKGCQRTYKDVVTPIGKFRVKSPTERQRASFSNGDENDLVAVFIQSCAVDEDGDRIFDDSQQTLEKIRELDASVTIPFGEALSDFVDTEEEDSGNEPETPDD
jgi:hypothetical protein